jgi:hypothetical protein
MAWHNVLKERLRSAARESGAFGDRTLNDGLHAALIRSLVPGAIAPQPP